SGGAAEATARERGARDDQAVGRVDGGLRVALVILEDDLERHRLSADLEAARIVDDSRGYLRASLRLGTFLGGSPRQRHGEADLDDRLCHTRRQHAECQGHERDAPEPQSQTYALAGSHDACLLMA